MLNIAYFVSMSRSYTVMQEAQPTSRSKSLSYTLYRYRQQQMLLLNGSTTDGEANPLEGLLAKLYSTKKCEIFQDLSALTTSMDMLDSVSLLDLGSGDM